MADKTSEEIKYLQNRVAELEAMEAVHRQSVEALQENDKKYRALVETTKIGYLIIDADGKVVEANQEYVRISGHKDLSEIYGRAVVEWTAEYEKEKNFRAVDQCIRQGFISDLIIDYVDADGRITPVEINATVIGSGKSIRIISLCRDITNRKQREQELNESRTLIDEVVENVPLMIFLKEAKDLRFVVFNRAGEELLGYDRKAMIGKSDLDFFPAEQAAHFMAKDREVLDGESGMLDIPEEPINTAKNGQRLLHTRKVSIRGSDGTTKYLLGISEDITDRKKVEKALEFSNMILRTQQETSIDGILIVGENGAILSYNRRFIEMWNIPPEIMESKSDERVLNSVFDKVENPEEFISKIKYLYENRSEVSRDEIILKDGKYFDRYSAPMRGDDKKYYGRVWYFRDITDRKKMEDELIIAHKLDSLGILAGGIAHDFNNMLTGIIGNISLARGELDPNNKLDELLRESENVAIRAKSLAKQLLTFSTGGAPVKKPAVLSQLLRDSVIFASRGTKLKCEFNLSPDLKMAEIDSDQIGQVISNIVINAVQAMPTGGNLSIQSKNVLIDKEYKIPLAPGNYVVFSIKDTGSGILPQYVDKVFDPYFSTKQEGRGLGLAITYSIVKQHGGHITVESEPGKGTIFSVYLPAYTGKADVNKLEKEPEVKRGSGRVLVMDDDKMICSMLQKTLARLGYSVEVSNDGFEAVSLYEKALGTTNAFDAVILDLTVPGSKGGVETINDLLKLDPKIKAVVSSGYSNDPVMSDHTKYGFSAVLPKPYGNSELSNVLHDLLVKPRKPRLII